MYFFRFFMVGFRYFLTCIFRFSGIPTIGIGSSFQKYRDIVFFGYRTTVSKRHDLIHTLLGRSHYYQYRNCRL